MSQQTILYLNIINRCEAIGDTINIDTQATVDDGSCLFLIVFRVDMFLNGGACALLALILASPLSSRDTSFA